MRKCWREDRPTRDQGPLASPSFHCTALCPPGEARDQTGPLATEAKGKAGMKWVVGRMGQGHTPQEWVFASGSVGHQPLL